MVIFKQVIMKKSIGTTEKENDKIKLWEKLSMMLKNNQKIK